MNVITFIVVLLFVMFRWRILEPILGTVKMYLFDAIMWTAYAAWVLANVGPVFWLDYICVGFGVLWAINAGRNYLKYDAIVRDSNGSSKSGPTEGS